jgi:LysM repeat protein
MSLDVTAKQAFGIVQKREAELAKLAQKTGDEYKDQKDVVTKDTLKVAPGLEKKSSEELAKLYETANQDGAEGLTETEFESLFNSVMAAETPAETTSAPQTITVKPGDTLSKIARQNNVSLDEIKQANPELFKDGKDSAGKTRSAGGNLIYPGDTIALPQKPPAKTEATKTEETKPKETKPAETVETPATEAQDPAAAVAAIKERTSGPDADQGTTWADHETTTKKELNFGHKQVDGALMKKSEQGDVVWSDNGKAVSWNQINAMPESQRQAYFKLAGVEPAPEREAIANNPSKVEPNATQKTQLAKETIDSAKLYELDPAALTVLTEEDLQSFKELDQKTLDGAKEALGQIPEDDATRADYESKVQTLEAEFDSRYGAPAAEKLIVVDENIDDNEARRMVSSRTPEEVDQLDIGTRIGMIKAMDRGATSVAEDQAIGQVAQSIARTHPEALTGDVVKHMDDNGVREFIKGSTAELLDTLPAETRGAMIQELAEGATSPEEDQMIGQLAASMAKTHPESISADVVRLMDDNGVRAMMDHVDAEGLGKLPADARAAMMQELIAGATSKEEDALIGRLGASLAATDPAALTPELVRGMDDNGVRAMTKDMTVADLAKLPRATLEAMRQELRDGWTTAEEYAQIDKITQALPNAQ